MSKELMYVLITKMHVKLNKVIENNDFNLLNDEVQMYSRRLDRVLTRYNKVLGCTKQHDCRHGTYKHEKSESINQ